jgi:putative transposase
MYDWRNLTEQQQAELLAYRRSLRRPWHSPPHRNVAGHRNYIISATCYEHVAVIGHAAKRMDDFSSTLVDTVTQLSDKLFAWCVLPNHYHVVLQTAEIEKLLETLGMLHGKTSYQWNTEECCRGRQVWFNAFDRHLRSSGHLWASINYVHHNPVKHGYVTRWQDWPWSSAKAFLDEVGPEQAKQLWLEYPVHDYGKGWDD